MKKMFNNSRITADTQVGLTETGLAEAESGSDSIMARLQGGRQSVRQLAQELQVPTPTMVMLVTNLVNKGYLRPVGGGMT